ncbi:cytochrome P450 [Obba rivulosa]|uniref:Cytochrome P450 n=1 Tax=Obba rivulosa TaxID=1052685 RepID=A0A8E2ATX0_9APHY|nr:cytochrome P450 [Obba rivulosa]
MTDIGLLTYALVAISGLYLLTQYLKPSKYKLSDIPTVGGPSLPILCFAGAWRFLKDGPGIIQEGYDKYKGGSFKFYTPGGWHVMITGPKLLEELRKAPDDQLSFDEATNITLQIPYTLGSAIHENAYHVPLVRSQLTRNIAAVFPGVRDEMVAAFNDVIPASSDGWTKVRAYNSIQEIVCRVSNRLFVGKPTCRIPEYCKVNITFTIDVVKCAAIINLFPDILKPMLTSVQRSIDRAQTHLKPIITERFQMMAQYGDAWPDKPNDFLQWLMDVAEGEERTVRALVLRILVLNFAAIHTSSNTFTHALYYLAANPEYIQPLREEVEEVVAEHGWSKASVGRMRKIDSFLKESQRLMGLGAMTMTRQALQDFSFSDGTFVPAGTLVSTPQLAVHLDSGLYEDPGEFRPWRFAEMREPEGEGTKHSMVSTSVDYVAFGHGRHACPGRFFAATELKTMLAHIAVNYDVKMEREGEHPPWSFFASALVPNTNAEVLFRKRQS